MILGFSVIKYTYSAYFFIVHYITSTHECHFIVFISMVIIFYFDSFHVLLLAVLNSMSHYLFLYPCKFLLLFFLLLWPESNAYLYSYFFTVILLYETKVWIFDGRGVYGPPPLTSRSAQFFSRLTPVNPWLLIKRRLTLKIFPFNKLRPIIWNYLK